MSNARLRLILAGYTESRAVAASVTFTALEIENGAAENVLIGRPVVTGTDEAYTVELTSTIGGLIKVSGDGVYTGAVPTNGQGTLAIAGLVRFTVSGTTLAFSGTCTIITPAFDAIPFGSTAYGSWAPTDPAALGIATQGSPGDFGYDEYAVGGWTVGNYDRLNGIEYIGVRAGKGMTLAHLNEDLASGVYRYGIKEVWLGANNPAEWLVISATDQVNHPLLANEGFIAPLRSDDSPASTPAEVRAILVPLVGKPYVLQGFPNPATTAWNGLPRINWSDDMWSLTRYIDKTGTALPSAVCYINSVTGNDANDGLTAGAAVQTGDRALVVFAAQKGNSDLSGCRLYYTAGLAQTFGCTASITTPKACATDWFRVMPAPGVALDDILITSATTSCFFCEKLSFELKKTCSIRNYDSAGTQAKNYVSTRFTLGATGTGYGHDGGPAVQANGQPNGAAFGEVGGGYNELINYPIHRTTSTNQNRNTLIINSPMTYVSNNNDACNNAKVYINSPCDFGTFISGGNHLDALQYFRSSSSQKIRNFVVEGVVAGTNWAAQGLLVKDGDVEDGLLINVECTKAGASSEVAGIFDPSKNVLHWNPKYTGGVNIGTTADFENTTLVLLPDSNGDDLADEFRFGKRVLETGMTVEPDVTRPDGDAFTARFGANLIDYVNADELSTVNRTRGTETVIEFINSISGITSYLPVTGRSNPTRNPDGIATGVATVEFLGDNTTSTSGSSLNKSSSPSSIAANNPVEQFLLVNNRAAGATTGTRDIASYGGSTNAAARSILRRSVSSANKVAVRIGGVTLDAPGTFDGVSVIHMQYDPSGQAYGIGLFNAANPTYGEDNYSRGNLGAVLTTGTTRGVLGGGTTTGGGAQNTWWYGGVNRRLVVNRVCTEAERQATIEELLAIAGIV